MIDLKKLILERTNAGQDIFEELYPEAKSIFRGEAHKKIRLRDERTPSASFRKTKDKNGNDCWMLKDFGSDTDWSCFDAYMHEKGIQYFGQAVRELAERYNIDFSISSARNKVKKTCRPSTPDEQPGIYLGERREPNEEELRVIGPSVTKEVMKRYNYQILKSYSVVKFDETKKMNITSTYETTDTYPIFVHDCFYEEDSAKGDGKKVKREFSKVYKPLETEKGYRFFYVGVKPRDFMNGYSEIKKYIDESIKENTHQNKNGFDEIDWRTLSSVYGISTERKVQKVVICSGERDALCLAGLGLWPIWFNSETAKVNSDTFGQIARIADMVYNIPDKDETGVRQGRKLALDHLDIRTIELPNWLSKFHDARQSSCKDFRDYVDILGKQAAASDFKKLMSAALAARFWEMTENDEGKKKVEIHAMNLLYFLKINGFAKFKDPITKEIYPIRIVGYTVERYEPVQIRDFVREELKRRQVSSNVMEAYINSKKASKQIYDDLDTIEIDFQYSDNNSRTIFFENTIVKITRPDGEDQGVECFNIPKDSKYVWKEKINPHTFKRLKPSFTYDWKAGTLAINHTSSHVMQFVINTCRTQWKREMEQHWDELGIIENPDKAAYMEQNRFELYGPLLSNEEKIDQAMNMLSKIYTTGYLMSQFKEDSCAKAVWAMENRITKEDESSGRSGKSLFFKCFAKLHLAEMVTLDGRNKKTTDNAHFMDRVSQSTDILLIDDAGKGFDFYTYYKMITGSIEVNPKNEKSFEIAYEDAPNIAFTSNYPLPNRDNSTLDRILFLSFSDWYHAKGIKGEYNESRSIRDDIGKDLFGYNYSEEEYNADINFMIDCLQFYLQCKHYNIPPIQPPIENILKRQLLEEIGTPFKAWADEYFTKEANHLNICIVKQAAYDDYCSTIKDKKFQKSAQSWKEALQDYVEYYEDIFDCLNPEDHPCYRKNGRERNGRLTSTCLYNGVMKTYELIYIKTKDCNTLNQAIADR